MEENLPDALLKAADALHWLGKYQVANACILMSRFARAHGIHTQNDLEELVAGAEKDLDALDAAEGKP